MTRTLEFSSIQHAIQFAPVLEFATIGPIVRVRKVTRQGFGSWRVAALTTNPRGYVRMVSTGPDVVPGIDR